jgi:hypothetical protein
MREMESLLENIPKLPLTLAQVCSKAMKLCVLGPKKIGSITLFAKAQPQTRTSDKL